MEDPSQPSGLKVTLPSRVSGPAVLQVPSRGILGGKRTKMECGAPHCLHGVDTVDNTGGPQGSLDFPLDHVEPIYVVDWEACCPLLGHSGGDPILSNKDNAGK